MKNKTQSDHEPPAADSQPPIKRKYSADNSQCCVTLQLPKEAAPEATSVAVSGSFNDWCVDRHPMKRMKIGDFSLELGLEAGK